MNEHEYRKQLLIQRIASHRGEVGRELERVSESNPLHRLTEFGHEFTASLGSLGIGSGSGARDSRQGVRFMGLDLSLALPIVIQLATALLRKRKHRS